MSDYEATDVAAERRDRRALERQLARAIAGVTLYLVLVGAASIVAVLMLLESARSTDLTRVAAVSLVGGALGAGVRALFDLMLRFEDGLWELSDGTVVSRSFRRAARARETHLRDTPRHPTRSAPDGPPTREDEKPAAAEPRDTTAASRDLSEREREERAAREAERQSLGLTPGDYQRLKRAEEEAAEARSFGLLDLPLLVLLPLLGAALGLVAFAGLVGGFLLASGSSSPSYSPTGLLFVAVLAGMFAPNFIGSLARAADAIFGKPQSGHPGADAK
jgi:hypothetical protein